MPPPLYEKTELEAKKIEPGTESTTPSGYLRVTLTQDQREKLETFVDQHVDSIEQEMGPTLDRFKGEDAQLEGNVEGADYSPGPFRMNVPVTKKKVREVANKIKQAYLDSDPLWGVGSKDPALSSYAQAVERALDTEVDNELEAEDDISMALFDAVLHGIGAVVPGWVYQEEQCRDVNTWNGFDGNTAESLADVMRFEQEYPDWNDSKDAKDIRRRLLKGETVSREITYSMAVRNCPEIMHVPADKIRVYPKVKGFSGLRTTPVYGFVKEFTRFELDDLAESGILDADQVVRATALSTQPITPDEEQSVEASMRPYEVFIGTIRYKLAGGESARYKVWQERKTGAILRIRHFPWFYGQPDLVVFYIRKEDPGFFKRGLAWDVEDDHIGQVVLFNMFLNAIDMANSMRWKVKSGSLAEQFMLHRDYMPNIPLPYKDNPDEAIPNATPVSHINSIVEGMAFMKQNSDDNTQTSSLQSGGDLPRDPTAPASKVALLLQQVEPNMKEYIRSLGDGFRQTGRWILHLYYQGIRLGWIEDMPGVPHVKPELLLHVANNLNPRALLFEYDRQGRMERNFSALSLMTSTYLPAGRSDLVAKAINIVVSQLDSQWAQFAEENDLANSLQQQPLLPAPADQPGSGGKQAGSGGSARSNGNGSSGGGSPMAGALKGALTRIGASA